MEERTGGEMCAANVEKPDIGHKSVKRGEGKDRMKREMAGNPSMTDEETGHAQRQEHIHVLIDEKCSPSHLAHSQQGETNDDDAIELQHIEISLNLSAANV